MELVPWVRMQKYRVFFGADDPLQRQRPGDSERRWSVSEDNPNCPLNKFVGNAGAVKKLRLAAYSALGLPDHCCNLLNFAFFGPASVGKTMLARLFAETVELPFFEIGPKQFRAVHSLLEGIKDILAESKMELTGELVPPMVVFIDEVHALSDGVIQALLKATERDDGILATEKGTIDCGNICWMIATTEEGDLPDPFRSRFSFIRLNYLTRGEIVQIIRQRYPDLPLNAAELAGFYAGRQVRKVLEFVDYMILTYNMEPRNWEDVAREVASNEGIGENGLTREQMSVLSAVMEHPVAQARLPVIVGIRPDELNNYILPELLVNLPDRPALLEMTSRGYGITEEGEKVLELVP